jgi:asparagine synthetase B (glutamine-hydrolysing)
LAGLLQYEDVGEEVVGMLDGMFSFVLVDLRDKSFIAARDPIGITPLYLGWGNDGTSSIKFPSCNFISTCSSRTYYCKIEVGEL